LAYLDGKFLTEEFSDNFLTAQNFGDIECLILAWSFPCHRAWQLCCRLLYSCCLHSSLPLHWL